jgi:hypothetical protein
MSKMEKYWTATNTLRAYPNNPLYPQGKPDACVVGEKTFSTWSKPLLASIFGLPPWLRTPP